MDSDQILQILFCLKYTSSQIQLTSFLRHFANVERSFLLVSVLSEPLPLAPIKWPSGSARFVASIFLMTSDLKVKYRRYFVRFKGESL